MECGVGVLIRYGRRQVQEPRWPNRLDFDAVSLKPLRIGRKPMRYELHDLCNLLYNCTEYANGR